MRVRVRIKFWQNAHVRAMCVRPKIKCANVRACEAKNRRNSQIVHYHSENINLWHTNKKPTNGRAHFPNSGDIVLNEREQDCSSH